MELKSMREQLDEAWNRGTPKEEEEEEVVATSKEEEKDGDAEAGGPKEDSKEPVRTAEEEEAKSEDGDKEPEKKPEGDGKEGAGKEKSAKTDAAGEESKAGAKKDEDAGLKAPVSWKPAIREHWGKIPKEAQGEILRREKEINDGLQQAAGFKRVAAEYLNLVKPYEHLIRAQNSTPSQAISNMMQTAARLAQGTKIQKAQCIAEIMKNYDVDVKSLDDILVGTVKPGDDPDAKIATLLDERLKPIVSFIDGVKGSQQETVKKTEQEISQNFQQFSEDPKNEFFEDVREDMADIIEMAANRGRVLTLPQAYEQACKLHPEVSKIIAQREAKKKGELNGEQLLRKRKAASSIKGNPEEEGGAKKNGEDLRGSILQAFDDLEQQ